MIPIIYAGNKGAFDGMLISILSLTKHTEEPLDIYILTMDLTEKKDVFLPIDETHRAFLDAICKEKNPNSCVTLLDVGDLYKSTLLNSPNATTSYTPYTFLRLFIDKLPLPDKVIYLDTDTVINGDIASLYETDIGEYEFGGALDYYGKVFMGRKYVNAGVLLLNLEKIRETSLFEKVIDLLNRKKVFLPDQTALNKLVKKKLILDGKYNEQKHFKDNTVIQHFTKTIIWLPFFHTRNIKPWHVDDVKNRLTHKYDDILDLYTQKKLQFEKESLK